eukprot:6208205-Pleurochrysis_carterae.AAC.3
MTSIPYTYTCPSYRTVHQPLLLTMILPVVTVATATVRAKNAAARPPRRLSTCGEWRRPRSRLSFAEGVWTDISCGNGNCWEGCAAPRLTRLRRCCCRRSAHAVALRRASAAAALAGARTHAKTRRPTRRRHTTRKACCAG